MPNKLYQFFQDLDLLFYGELEETLPTKLIEVLEYFNQENKSPITPYIFEEGTDTITKCEFWLISSLLYQQDLIEYGSSPRFAWLTEEGKVILHLLQEYQGDWYELINLERIKINDI